jgi:hypothetical protein
MVARATLKSGQLMLLAVFAMAPAAGFAQQDNASQNQKQQDLHQQEAAQTNSKTEQAPSEKVPSPTQAEGTESRTEETPAKTAEDPKLKSVQGGKALGMSILGNQEAPKALVIVPWKRSELGNALDVSTMLDDSRLPIDKEVFMRMLSYYEIRSGVTPPSGASSETNVSSETSANGRKK